MPKNAALAARELDQLGASRGRFRNVAAIRSMVCWSKPSGWRLKSDEAVDVTLVVAFSAAAKGRAHTEYVTRSIASMVRARRQPRVALRLSDALFLEQPLSAIAFPIVLCQAAGGHGGNRSRESFCSYPQRTDVSACRTQSLIALLCFMLRFESAQRVRVMPMAIVTSILGSRVEQVRRMNRRSFACRRSGRYRGKGMESL